MTCGVPLSLGGVACSGLLGNSEPGSSPALLSLTHLEFEDIPPSLSAK